MGASNRCLLLSIEFNPGEGKGYPLQYFGLENSMDCIVHGVARVRYYLGTKPHSQDNIRASLVAQLIKNLPAMWETWVQSLGWEDPLEKEKATRSSILAWRTPRTV